MLVLELGGVAVVDHLAFSPNGRALVGTAEDRADNRMVLWPKLAAGRQVEWVTGGSFALHPRYTANGKWIFAGLTKLMRFDPKTHDHIEMALWENGTFGFDLAPNKPLVLVTQHDVGKRNTTRVALWRADKLTPAGKVWERSFSSPPYRNWAAFLPGGDRFVRFDVDIGPHTDFAYRLTTFDTATGKPVGEPGAVPHGGSISPDGRWLVDCYATTINLFPLDPAAGKEGCIKNPTKKHFTGFAFHPSGKYLAATGNDETVRLYDLTTREEARAFTWRIGKMRSITFSRDGTLAAAGSDKGQVVVWGVDL